MPQGKARRARSEAILRYFSAGEGALDRRYRFAHMVLRRSITWTVIFGAITSYAVMAILTFGLGHEQALAELHAWMNATPVEEVIERVRSIFRNQLLNCMQCGVAVALFLTLDQISKSKSTLSGNEK